MKEREEYLSFFSMLAIPVGPSTTESGCRQMRTDGTVRLRSVHSHPLSHTHTRAQCALTPTFTPKHAHAQTHAFAETYACTVAHAHTILTNARAYALAHMFTHPQTHKNREWEELSC